METALMARDALVKLLRCDMSHTDLPRDTVNCCSIGDIFFEVERLKKQGHSMARVIEGTTELQKAIEHYFAHVAPLDSQSLQSGLFDEAEPEPSFFDQAITAEHPSDTITIIALRDFDGVWSTNFLATRFSN